MKNNPEVAQFAICYLSDFNLQVSTTVNNLVQDALMDHISQGAYTLRDLAYISIAVSQHPNSRLGDEKSNELRQMIQDEIAKRMQAETIAEEDTNLRELISLAYPDY